MSTNLRLTDEAASALRHESVRTGRSQQDLMREALDRYLGLERATTDRQRAVASGRVLAPTEFVDAEPQIQLGHGQDSLRLLDRDER